MDINTNVTDSTKYNTKFLRGNTKVVANELLKPRNVPDISLIPIPL